ncbi:MAG: radical SAM-associated putative lipoprotein [Bacteroidales bacterium]|nr:radical SAM-associated putative lipoprotein [Bacteroidales bacterium]MBN2819315.1 radical SAM-associated putative lipoprotein [Bacteroidales bacterium]
MKKLKIRYFKNFNAIIGFLLSLLGFASVCNSCATDYGVEPDEYGVPYATFKVAGTVESKESSEHLENIRVIFAYQDTAYTDENGNYEVSSIIESLEEAPISFEDVDGAQNGSYRPFDTIVDFGDNEFTGGDGWDKGTAKEDLDVKLDEVE